jgi:DNA-binding response OmpR family regulator
MHICSALVSPDLLAGKVVLVVEPQVPIALLERSVALELGAKEALTCASARDGLAMIESGMKPDVAIVDLGAEEAASTLIARLDAAGVMLVITSADDAPDRADASAFIRITKPYLETELVGAIAAAVARRQPGA